MHLTDQDSRVDCKLLHYPLSNSNHDSGALIRFGVSIPRRGTQSRDPMHALQTQFSAHHDRKHRFEWKFSVNITDSQRRWGIVHTVFSWSSKARYIFDLWRACALTRTVRCYSRAWFVAGYHSRICDRILRAPDRCMIWSVFRPGHKFVNMDSGPQGDHWPTSVSNRHRNHKKWKRRIFVSSTVVC